MTDQPAKVALVTGASRGIGKACAKALAAQGYRVAVHYRSGEEEANALCRELDNSLALKADVANLEDCKNLIKITRQELGRIDVLVNNAGISIDQLITFAKPEDFSKTLDVNLKSVFNLTKLVSKVMIKQKGGRIINLSSVVGYTGNSGQSMYAASKGAITAFTKSVSADLAQYGILVNSVAPGFIETEMTSALPQEVQDSILNGIPLKRLGSPKEIADVVTFLASPAASYITGSTIHVNGGMFPN
ncbi:MAG: beta-ketoacyl-ACP reductase [Zetaproteobacteria bacterium]|nr:beta-ketoacyl-ACP reductase [Pseudobdellovibrionaceae bacterium]|tara:strand:- start:147 stop:884 length:738 start_codon:yes stop_codon:yes gene_type:complete